MGRVTACRSCGGGLGEPVLDLGTQALPDFSHPVGDFAAWERAPLALAQCQACGLHQLTHTVAREKLFSQYWYRSSTAETMRRALDEVASAGRAAAGLGVNDVVLDIGSNDGYLLDNFRRHTTIGFEPSRVPFQDTFALPDITVNAPFNAADYHTMAQRAKLVFSVAMFYSVEDPDTFVRDVASVLADDGVWVLQMNDLIALADGLAYDIIGHEHVCVWSLRALEPLLARHGLYVDRVERLPVNGGTARFLVRHGVRRAAPDPSLIMYQLDEERVNARRWPEWCAQLIGHLREGVMQLHQQGARVHIYGASTRGATIIQSAMLDSPLIEAAADRLPSKHGMLMPGTTIPIVSDEVSRAMDPDFYLALPYSYIDQFREREHAFLARGGRFLIPVPEVHIL